MRIAYARGEHTRPAAEVAHRVGEDMSLYLCKSHRPEVWEGDGTCVVCEGQRAVDERQAARTALRDAIVMVERLTKFDHHEDHVIDTDEEPENCDRCKSLDALIESWHATLGEPE
jgi:hypothetical protein